MIGELTAGLAVSGRRVPEQMVAAVMPFVVEVCGQPKVVAKWTMYIGQRWMRGTGADLEHLVQIRGTTTSNDWSYVEVQYYFNPGRI